VLSQTSENPLHALQLLSVGELHVTPLVLRVQVAISLRGLAMHAPLRHVWSVHARVWVPDASHTELKSPHGPNGPHVVPAPHVLPSFRAMATQLPVPRSHTPTLHSSFFDEQSTAPNTQVCETRLQVPGFEHRSGGVRQSVSPWHWTMGASGGASTAASIGVPSLGLASGTVVPVV
jgi:hypothetical protein